MSENDNEEITDEEVTDEERLAEVLEERKQGGLEALGRVTRLATELVYEASVMADLLGATDDEIDDVTEKAVSDLEASFNEDDGE